MRKASRSRRSCSATLMALVLPSPVRAATSAASRSARGGGRGRIHY
jgi:hypothetical protein